MSWDKIIGEQRQAKYPSEHFVRFVARNYCDVADRRKVKFLDIGCGGGANTWFLWNENFHVTAVDTAHGALANFHYSIEDMEFDDSSIDCILDHNSLCHIEEPPIENIRRWLKPGGKFFCVAPTNRTWRGHLEGKGFCRCANANDMAKMLAPFSDVKVNAAAYTQGPHTIESWVIEATR